MKRALQRLDKRRGRARFGRKRRELHARNYYKFGAGVQIYNALNKFNKSVAETMRRFRIQRAYGNYLQEVFR